MTEELRAVALFHSTSHAIKAERLIKKSSIHCDMIPVPRHLSSDCGICIRFLQLNKIAITEILSKNNVSFEGPIDLCE